MICWEMSGSGARTETTEDTLARIPTGLPEEPVTMPQIALVAAHRGLMMRGMSVQHVDIGTPQA
jgi:hypothetical protein